MTTATPQQQIKATLESAGIPYKQIDVFGSQIIVTAWSHHAAKRWGILLARFTSKVRGIVKSLDQTVESEGRKPEYVAVWRVGAMI